MYVAVTRSKYICYLMWGSITTKTSSSLDYQFFADESIMELEKGNKVLTLEKTLKKVKTNQIPPELTEKQEDYITVNNSLHESTIFPMIYNPQAIDKKEKLTYRKFPLNLINHTWRIASFSSLAPHDEKYIKPVYNSKDYDEGDNSAELNQTTIPDDKINIFNFPAGAKTGTCWHEIFEDLDFTANEGEILDLVKEKLSLYNLNEGKYDYIISEKETTVTNMVKKCFISKSYKR